ncbi:MAG TPA: hypothetical protein VNF04_02030 [Stellaceae bacterium]|nr:hypothetical protein [Stellaceae bacterium]
MAALCAGLAVFAVACTSFAQAPPYPAPPVYPPAPPLPASPETTEIAACLCLGQTVSTLSADLTAKQQAYQAAQDELARLDAQLRSARRQVDVNNPQSVAQFRQLLAQRDGAFRRDRGPVFTDMSRATERYNARISEYNARCANQPRNPDLLNQVQATLSCPPAY